jgi:hypothetical protein
MKTTNKKFKVTHGLNPLPEDKRDLKHSQVFGVSPTSLPTTSFDVFNGSVIKNQYDLDFCAGFSTSEINEDMQNKIFCPLYQFAKIKQVEGDFRTYGSDLRTACKSLVKFGSLPIGKSPYIHDPSNSESKSRDFLANWTNWPPSLDILAGEFKCGSFFAVDGPYDNFDNIRSVLWQNKDEHRGVEFGVMWRDEWTYAPNGVIPEAKYKVPAGGGHALKIVGQKIINGVPYLTVQNSWGTDFGDKGLYYFPRSVINIEVKNMGAFTMKDMDAATAKTYIAYNLTTQDGVMAMIVKIILSLFNDFKTLLS